ncbi:hypothetical protein [uncultured Parasphingopyxis sp.]|uniref:hypothetical protein n=1 Tax=uncultured Parasphingopyxis sp. TaxID=1547918 RepID=UPI002610475F|nr:hypothetical protein [uncultured Parasphingopyxis sp.]
MNIRITTLGIMATIAIAAPAYAFQSDVGSGAEEADVTSATRVICREAAPPTGSRIRPRRICKTEAEWGRLDDEVDRTMWNERLGNRMYNEGAGTGCGALNRGC